MVQILNDTVMKLGDSHTHVDKLLNETMTHRLSDRG